MMPTEDWRLTGKGHILRARGPVCSEHTRRHAPAAALPCEGGAGYTLSVWGSKPRRRAVGAALPSGRSLPTSAKQGNDTAHPRGAWGFSVLVLTARTAEA